MHLRLILAAALAVGLSSAAQAQVAQVVTTCGSASLPLGPGGRLFMDSTGVLCTTAGSGGGSSSTGSVTAAGTNGSVAQAVQGITGGIPQNSFPAQYNSTLPTLASGATGYLAVDGNGRQILSPSTSVSVSNFPATQTVAGTVTANLGTIAGVATAANQNVTAAGTSAANAQAVQGVTGGIPQNVAGTVAVSNAFALDATVTARLGTLGQKAAAGSAPVVIASDQSSIATKIDQTTPGTTNKVSLGSDTVNANVTASALPSGAATATNQASEVAALGAPADAAWSGSGNSSIVAALKAIYPRALPFPETVGFGVASGGAYTGATRDAGTVNPWSKFNAVVAGTGTGTLTIQGSNDNFSTNVTVAQVSATANSFAVAVAPVLFRYHRAIFTNTAGATNTIALNTSYTAN